MKLSRTQKLRALGFGDYVSDEDTAALKILDANGSPLSMPTLGQTFSQQIPARVWTDFAYGYAVPGTATTGPGSTLGINNSVPQIAWAPLDFTFAANIQSAWMDAQASSNSAIQQSVSDTQQALQTAGAAADAVYIAPFGNSLVGNTFAQMRSNATASQVSAYNAQLQNILQAFADFLTSYVSTAGSAAVVKFPLASGPAGNAALNASAVKINPNASKPVVPQAPPGAMSLSRMPQAGSFKYAQQGSRPVTAFNPGPGVVPPNAAAIQAALQASQNGAPAGAVVDSTGAPVYVDTSGVDVGTDWGSIALYAVGGLVGLTILIALVRR